MNFTLWSGFFSLEEGEGEGILTALDLVLAVVTGGAVVDSFRC